MVCLKILTYIIVIDCTDLRYTLFFDDGSQFRDDFVETFVIHGVEYQNSGTQNYSALRVGESYHEPIRRSM